MDSGTLTKLFCILVLLAPVPGSPQPSHDHTALPSPKHLRLSPDLAQLLRQEMNAIQQGMQSLLPAIVSGDWKTTAEIAEQVQHSYLLEQRLTAEQREALQHTLPPGFRERDQAFHHFAGRLAQAAQRQEAEVVNFYFYKLTEACIACHTRFAAHRFPGLATDRSHAPPTH